MVNYKWILARHKVLVPIVVDFYLSSAINIPHFNDIIDVLSSLQNPKEPDKNRIKLGIFSIKDFLLFASEKKLFEGGISMRYVEVIVDMMEQNLLLTKQYDFGINKPATYQANVEYVKVVYSMGLVNNILFGFPYIIENYSNAVLKIVNKDKHGEIGIGTGFLVRRKNQDILITNAHNLEKADSIKVLDKDDNPINFEVISINEKYDVAILKIEKPPTILNFFRFKGDYEILSEIITIGYPKIPLTKAAYQVCHRGEINSEVEDYYDNKLFLISAKTSSGNSGSPVIDSSGLVLGMVARELFEKSEFQEKGKPPYIGVIPSSVISLCMEEADLEDKTGLF